MAAESAIFPVIKRAVLEMFDPECPKFGPDEKKICAVGVCAVNRYLIGGCLRRWGTTP